MRFIFFWRTISNPRDKDSKMEERRLMEIMFDKQSINEEILNLKKTLKENKEKSNYKGIKRKKQELIDCMDYAVYKNIKQLENKYSELYIKYSSIVNMILDIYYPRFYRNIVEKIPYKHPNKKYHEVTMFGPVFDFILFS